MCDSFATPWTVAPPGSSVRGILQTRILEWVAISFSRGSSRLRDWTWIFCIRRQILYHWATSKLIYRGYVTIASSQTRKCKTKMVSIPTNQHKLKHHAIPLTQREGMGTTGIPVADSFQCLAKLIQYCKV